MIIRLEEEKDYFEVENLTREAFWNVYRPGCFEHFVLHNLRKDDCFIKDLDYVIEEDGKIVANIVYAKANIKLLNGIDKEALIFGPVSVLPTHQHKGYGEAIINYTIAKAEELGFDAIFITGNPDYYKKFGFEPCSKYEIYYEGIDKSDPAPFFMVKVLNKEAIFKMKGEYSDPKCYMANEEDVDAFDKNFPKKTKLKLEGQLG